MIMSIWLVSNMLCVPFFIVLNDDDDFSLQSMHDKMLEVVCVCGACTSENFRYKILS
jgi:hypothetical protein